MTNREHGLSGEMTSPVAARRDAARAAQARADKARERALAAAERATTEYARRIHHRVADLHAWTAASEEDCARTLRSGARDAEIG